MACGAAWSGSDASRFRITSAPGVSATTSNRHDASTTSIGPVAAPLVEGVEHLEGRDVGGAAAGPFQSLGHGRPRRQLAGTHASSHEFRSTNYRFAAAAGLSDEALLDIARNCPSGAITLRQDGEPVDV
jgi:hypothetical protein